MAHCARDACKRWWPDLLAGMTGVVIEGRWYCSIACVKQIARQRLRTAGLATGSPRDLQVRLGVWLQVEGALNGRQLQYVLEAQRESGLPIGAQVIAMSMAPPVAVLRALAKQAGLPYLTRIDYSKVADAQEWLSPPAARVLSIVPIAEPKEGRVKVACAAPTPYRGLGAFQRVTGLTPEPFLVTDADWSSLMSTYGSTVEADEFAPFVETRNWAEAVDSIAAAVKSSRSVRFTDARFDARIWVRVHGDADGAVKDIVLSVTPAEAVEPVDAPPAATPDRTVSATEATVPVATSTNDPGEAT